jgi:hypothetical protein
VSEIRFHPEALVELVLGLILANPEMFPTYDETHRFVMLRRFPYSLVYRSQPDRVDIIAVAHSRRASGYWKPRA